MRTGKIKVGARNLKGVTKSAESRDEELIRRGYRIELTPNGRIVHPPKK